jgi:hypothetical protein
VSPHFVHAPKSVSAAGSIWYETALDGIVFFERDRVEVPRIHDVSAVIEENLDRLPASIPDRVGELSDISRSLRRDRELSFCGSEDLTPSEFYRPTDAESAPTQATLVATVVPTATATDRLEAWLYQGDECPGGTRRVYDSEENDRRFCLFENGHDHEKYEDAATRPDARPVKWRQLVQRRDDIVETDRSHDESENPDPGFLGTEVRPSEV